MMAGRVAMFIHEDDGHVPYVARHLGEAPYIFNAGAIPSTGLSCSIGSHKPGLSLTQAGEAINLGDVKSVWYRSLDVERLTGGENFGLSGPMLPYAMSSLTRLAETITYGIPSGALWVSRPQALRVAASKSWQLELAQELGFEIPEDTLFTNEPAEADAFLRRHGTCVIKPLAIRPPKGFNQYTRVLRCADRPDFSEGLNINAHILETLEEGDYELRVAVVGTEVHASSVWDSAAEVAASMGIRDFRFAFERGTFEAEAAEIPPRLAHMCVELVRRLGLLSGMLDIVVRRGKHILLEVNGNGQWAFVDEETVDLVGHAFARLLDSAVVPNYAA